MNIKQKGGHSQNKKADYLAAFPLGGLRHGIDHRVQHLLLGVKLCLSD